MLGQIEREESSPSISTLWKIASGFHTSFSSFIKDMGTHGDSPVYRSGPPAQINALDEKIRIISLFPFDNDLNCEMFLIELLPDCEHLSPPHESGVIEHVIVVDGKIDLLVNDDWQTLHKGEGLRFNADRTHCYRNPTSKTASFHNVIHYPKQPR